MKMMMMMMSLLLDGSVGTASSKDFSVGPKSCWIDCIFKFLEGGGALFHHIEHGHFWGMGQQAFPLAIFEVEIR